MFMISNILRYSEFVNKHYYSSGKLCFISYPISLIGRSTAGLKSTALLRNAS